MGTEITKKIAPTRYFSFLYLILVVLDLLVTSFDATSLRMATKPMILLSLLLYFAIVGWRLQKRTYVFMLFALFSSWVGDVMLLFDHASGLYFILGLLSFLIAHCCYILVFLRKWHPTPPPYFSLVALLLMVYGSTLFYILKDGIGTLSTPVAIYVVGILFMAVTAFRRLGSVGTRSFYLVFCGALFFIASDSLLAINKFLMPLPWTSVFVMATYATAQYLIVRGILSDSQSSG
ncbi:MAG: lysoplasmalogenase [Maribacter sp.]|nr:lysoplasmalogenase [Maribacter sp.]